MRRASLAVRAVRLVVPAVLALLAGTSFGQDSAAVTTPPAGVTIKAVEPRLTIKQPRLDAMPRVDLQADATLGYYRMPAIHGETIVFVSEGDLWKVSTKGGRATRLTTHAGDETLPAISPDGKLVAFVGTYEGPAEVYTMPIEGGLPTRRTWDGARVGVAGWTPDGKLLFTSNRDAPKRNIHLFALDLATNQARAYPLAQASDAAAGEDGTVFFTRLPFQGSWTDRYKGGTVQQLWSWTPPAGWREGQTIENLPEAKPLTTDYPGTSRRAMVWKGRVYFVSDRDGFMNLWSMKPDGTDLEQHTKHTHFDIGSASLEGGKIVYQLGADLRLFDISAGKDQALSISLDSDFDQTREKFVQRPLSWVTSVDLSPTGDKVALVARGLVFVAPAKQGRLVEVPHREGVRHRNARFMPDGKSIVSLSDESGEVELWKLPASGVGEQTQLTSDGVVLRWDSVPSPDGKLIAHHDKNQRLWIYDVEGKRNTLIADSIHEDFGDLTWSPDSQWLAWVEADENTNRRIVLWSVADGTRTFATTDRFNSFSPAWSRDGKWLYFLSDRHLQSVVGSPWGPRAPEPFFDKQIKVYQIALKAGTRSPFRADDEVEAARVEAEKAKKKDEAKPAETKPAETKPTETKPVEVKPADAAPAQSPSEPKKDELKKDEPKKDEGKKDEGKKDGVKVEIDLDGLTARLEELPVPPGNYSGLSAAEKALFFVSAGRGEGGEPDLVALPITNDSPELKVVLSDIRQYQLSQDGKKLLIRKGDQFAVVDAAPAPASLEKKTIDLSGMSFSVTPREEWRQMLVEAWRLMRDYFYDLNMHGVDWKAALDRHLPLVTRVRSRAELSDLLGHMVSELSALHHFVSGGDMRRGDDNVQIASLGARLSRDEAAGGFRVTHIAVTDPDEPSAAAPLARPGVNVKVGDIIKHVNGVPTLSVPDISVLLRQKAGRQVLLRVADAAGAERDVIVEPITSGAASNLRYDEWEYTRRLRTEALSKGQVGYVHLRAMGTGDMAQFVRDFYPVFHKPGLIIDVRDNGGGNIDSWILSRLLRKSWFFWNQRVGRSNSWNMQYAFRGHVVVLCNEHTGSDGEAFAEGIRRLNIGTVLGTRTWGGEIWLTSSNVLVDRGLASAAEFGVFGPEGTWLIEGHGVEPDVVVDNLPVETYQGADKQLDAAVNLLIEKISADPRAIPPVPALPDKSFKK